MVKKKRETKSCKEINDFLGPKCFSKKWQSILLILPGWVLSKLDPFHLFLQTSWILGIWHTVIITSKYIRSFDLLHSMTLVLFQECNDTNIW